MGGSERDRLFQVPGVDSGSDAVTTLCHRALMLRCRMICSMICSCVPVCLSRHQCGEGSGQEAANRNRGGRAVEGFHLVGEECMRCPPVTSLGCVVGGR